MSWSYTDNSVDSDGGLSVPLPMSLSPSNASSSAASSGRHDSDEARLIYLARHPSEARNNEPRFRTFRSSQQQAPLPRPHNHSRRQVAQISGLSSEAVVPPPPPKAQQQRPALVTPAPAPHPQEIPWISNDASEVMSTRVLSASELDDMEELSLSQQPSVASEEAVLHDQTRSSPSWMPKWLPISLLKSNDNNSAENGSLNPDSASKASLSFVSDTTPRVSNVRRHKNGKAAAGSPSIPFYKTRSGKIIVSMVIILALAVMIIIISTLTTRNKGSDSDRDDPSTNLQFSGRDNGVSAMSEEPTIYPQPPRYSLNPSAFPGFDDMTGAPTIRPTAQPTILVTKVGSIDTSSPTSTPVQVLPETESPSIPYRTISPTIQPSTTPTSLLATAQPTFQPTTTSPTITASESPSTRSPSTLPSYTPTTPVPSTSPKTKDPTLQPSHLPSSSPSSRPTSALRQIDFDAQDALISGISAGEQFGSSIAFSGNGRIMAVGSPQASGNNLSRAGKVSIYEHSGDGSWVIRGVIEGDTSDLQLGRKSTLALSENGSILVIGEPFYSVGGFRRGRVQTFVFGPFNKYDALGNDIVGEVSSDQLGTSVSLSRDGTLMAVGIPNFATEDRSIVGQVQIWEFSTPTSQWELRAALEGKGRSSEEFGASVSMTDNGHALCVGAPRNIRYGGYVRCFSKTSSTGQWEPLGRDIENNIEPLRFDDAFGYALSVSGSESNSFRVAIGSPNKNGPSDSGRVGVYEYQEALDSWIPLGKEVPSLQSPEVSDQYGFSVDLRGSALAIGAPGRGLVDVLEYSSLTDEWTRTALLTGDFDFGYAVHFSDQYELAASSTAAAPLVNTPGFVQVYRE